MVPTAVYYPDQSYLFAFLLSSRLFITPNDLFSHICDICEHQQLLQTYLSSLNTADDNDQQTKHKSFAKNFVQLLQEWTNTFPYDFRDDRLMKQTQSMVQKCIAIDSMLQGRTAEMFQILAKRLNILDKYEEECSEIKSKHINNDFTDQYKQTDGNIALTYGGSGHNGSNSTNSSTIDIMELCSTSTQLAHHLTHIELEYLSHIGPEEFVQAFAKENSNHLVKLDSGGSSSRAASTARNDSKKLSAQSQKIPKSDKNQEETISTSALNHGCDKSGPIIEQEKIPRNDDIKKTRNLETYVQWFNRLSYLVATEIVKVKKCVEHVKLSSADPNYTIAFE